MPNTNVFTLDEINKILEQLNAHPGARLQYIGSRYVPIFGRKGEDSIEWNNTGAYEPLTIVLYQGNSYTSRQFVPVGIDINNKEYWANTGNYNAQIEQYRQEVKQYQNDVLSFDGRITALENPPKEKMIVIGDSFTDKDFAQSPIWCDAIGSILDYEVVNVAKSGCGYLAGNSTFITQLVEAGNMIDDVNTVKYIFIYGSINDLNLIQGSNLYKAAVSLLLEAKKYPRAQIICATPTRYNGTIELFKEMCRQIQFACYAVPAAFVNTTTWLRNNSTYIDETLHPSVAGQKALTAAFLGIMNGQPYRDEYYASFTLQNAEVVAGGCFVQGNIGVINVVIDHTTNYPANTPLTIGTVNNSGFNGSIIAPVYNDAGEEVGTIKMDGTYNVNTSSAILTLNLTEETSKIQFSFTYVS